MRDEESGVVRALRDGNRVATESGLLSLHPRIAEINLSGQLVVRFPRLATGLPRAARARTVSGVEACMLGKQVATAAA